jgi:pyruvate/2-oxoglutarate dehydrogenase complex dihydrolipoamide dehydrogenase (E3) component
MAKRFVIIGGGPAGNTAATYAARFGAEVTMIEKDIVGGAAHLRDCIPSKAMIATGGALGMINEANRMGLTDVSASLDFDALRARIARIGSRLERSTSTLLSSQGVTMISGTGRMIGPHEVVVDTADGPVEVDADVVLISTGSRPRIPDWADVDGARMLTTRDAYPPPELPRHLVVIGSGVTGVEFVHMFSSFGCEVSLIVSRQQVLPQKDPEVAAALEADFLERGVRLLKGAKAVNAIVDEVGVTIECTDGRQASGSHALLAIGSLPNTECLGLEAIGVETDNGYVKINHNCQTTLAHVYAAGDVSGKLPLSSVASIQGRKIAEHAMGLHVGPHRHIDYEKAASAIFTVPEIADVGLAEADAFAEGRKIRVTKVPFSANAKALIEDDGRGFVKIISDPATGVVLGGSIVGSHAAELIAVVALAVSAGLRVSDLHESLFVHPSMSEAISDAAE